MKSERPRCAVFEPALADLARALRLHSAGMRLALAGEILAAYVERSFGPGGRTVLDTLLRNYVRAHPAYSGPTTSLLFGPLEAVYDVRSSDLSRPTHAAFLEHFVGSLMQAASASGGTEDQRNASLAAVEAVLAASGPLWAPAVGRLALARFEISCAGSTTLSSAA